MNFGIKLLSEEKYYIDTCCSYENKNIDLFNLFNSLSVFAQIDLFLP